MRFRRSRAAALTHALSQDELVAAVASRLPREEAEDRGLRKFDLLERGRAGAVEATVAELEVNLFSAVLQERGCSLLYDLIRHDLQRRAQAAAAGAVEALVAALRAHPQSAGVQRAACLALCIMAFSDDSGIKAGAVAALVAAMRVELSSADVQLAACKALVSSSFRNADNKAKAVAAGALAALVAAMQAHLQSEDVQCRACCALYNLAFNNYEAKAGAVGAVEAVVAATLSRRRRIC